MVFSLGNERMAAIVKCHSALGSNNGEVQRASFQVALARFSDEGVSLRQL